MLSTAGSKISNLIEITKNVERNFRKKEHDGKNLHERITKSNAKFSITIVMSLTSHFMH
jgi:hypothetical protein